MRGNLRCILFHDTSDAQHSLPLNNSFVSNGIRHCYVSSCFGTKTITRFFEETTHHHQWVVVVLTATQLSDVVKNLLAVGYLPLNAPTYAYAMFSGKHRDVGASFGAHGIRHCSVPSCFGTKAISSEETSLHHRWVVVVLTATQHRRR